VGLLCFDAVIVNIERNMRLSLDRKGLPELLADMAHNRRMRLGTFNSWGPYPKLVNSKGKDNLVVIGIFNPNFG